MFFLQMSGFPGSGKSTLAREIAKFTKAVIIDHDIVKTGLLEGLSQGHSVILDSPCLYDVLVEKGTTLAEKHSAKYKYVECVLNDIHELNNRLKNRVQMITQIGPVDIPEERWQEAINRAKKPSHLECMKVDTSQRVDYYIGDVLLYINK